MISPISWKYFLLNLRIGKWTCGVPFEWSPEQGSVIVSERGKRMLSLVMVNSSLYLLYLAYWIHFDLQYTPKSPAVFRDIVMRVAYMFICFLVLLCMWNVYKHANMYVLFVNEWIKLYEYVDGKVKLHFKHRLAVFTKS